VWSPSIPLVDSQAELLSPVLIAGADGQFHALWVEKSESVDGVLEASIYYAVGNDSQWSRPAPIHIGEADQLAGALDTEGHLLLAWRDKGLGTLFFSRVNVDEAIFPLQWSIPSELVSAQNVHSAPDIHVDENSGVVYVAYAIPFNEGRGIFLIQSEDGGISWTEPVKVFDGAAAGWEVVDEPDLTLTEEGVHVIWSRYSVLTGSGALALFYARSEDGGQHWSEPETVSDAVVMWSQIAAIGERTLLRMWQESTGDGGTLWYQPSFDSGNSWGRSTLIPGFGDFSGATSVVVDAANQAHMLQVTTGEDDTVRLREWMWQDSIWLISDEIELPTESAVSPMLSTDVSRDGRLLTIYSSVIIDQDSMEQHSSIFSTGRLYDTSIDTGALQSTPIPTVEPSGTGTPLPEPLPATPPPTLPPIEGSSSGLQLGPIDTSTSTGGMVVGILAAALIIVIVFVIGSRLRRPRG
jgi:hypothetical protein